MCLSPVSEVGWADQPPAATGGVRDAWVSGGGLCLAWMAGGVADGCGGAASRRVSLLYSDYLQSLSLGLSRLSPFLWVLNLVCNVNG